LGIALNIKSLHANQHHIKDEENFIFDVMNPIKTMIFPLN